MMDDRCDGITSPQSHVKGTEDKLGLQVVGHRPADDLTSKEVDHRSQLEEASRVQM
jgi:hypothetical protein